MTMTDAPTTDTPTTDPDPEPSTELATPDPAAEAEAHLATLAAGAGLDTIPGREELAGLAAMAVTLAAAHALPDALRGKPNDVFLVLLTGRELGLAPAAALRSLYVVHGSVTLPPKVRAALVRQRGLGRLWPDPANNATSATWHTTKADEDHQVTYSFTFTMDDAARVPEGRGKGTLADKYATMGYPQRMLSWRALGYLLDDHYSEVGTGLYSPDEMGAMVDDDGHAVIDVGHTDPLEGMNAPRGHGPAQSDPKAEPADEADQAELRRRITALPSDEARAVLLELWSADRDGAEPLPYISHLQRRHLVRAKAMVASIEARAKKGEWGEWAPPADPATGEVAGAAGGEGTPGGDPVGSGGAAGSIPATATPAPDPASPHQQASAGRPEPEAVPTPTAAPEPRLAPDGAPLCELWEWCDEVNGHPGECIDALGQTRTPGT